MLGYDFDVDDFSDKGEILGRQIEIYTCRRTSNHGLTIVVVSTVLIKLVVGMLA